MTRSWDTIWKEYNGPKVSFDKLKQNQLNTCKRITDKINLSKNAQIIDIACGSGSTVKMFHELGFHNTIGIDNSKAALDVCDRMFGLKANKDVFLMDAKNIAFQSASFDMVFSDGLLEHFKKLPWEIMNEMCRLSRQWILLFQPNQSSIYWKLFWIWQQMGMATWEKEYRYSRNDYIVMFDRLNFRFVESSLFNLNGSMSLLFLKEK